MAVQHRPAARALLEATGWTAPDPDALPTGGDLISGYLAPLAAHPAIAPHLRFGAAVTAIARQGFDKVRTAGREDAPFLLRLADGSELLASAVIDASGTWRTPNPLGGNGLARPRRGRRPGRRAGLRRHARRGRPAPRLVRRQRRWPWSGPDTRPPAPCSPWPTWPTPIVHWVLRAPNPSRAYGGGDADALPARGAIGTRVRALVDAGRVNVHTGFFVHEVTEQGLVSADGRKVDADVIVNATGARPDHTPATELRLDLDPILGSTRALAPLIDPNQHSCGTVPPHGVDELAHPEPGFYVVGAKSYGRAPTFLLATGYEQARSVVAALAGDWDAARDVQLDCPRPASAPPTCPTTAADASCCGPAPADAQRGLATGVAGGLVTLPLVSAATSGDGCC